MTINVNEYEFLLRQKPICSQSPVKSALGPELHRELRAKYKLELQVDLLDDRCTNAFNCLANDSGCIGRPFPIDDKILEAVKSVNVEVENGIFKGREVYLAKATLCGDCPFKETCTNPCATEESFLRRSATPDLSPTPSMTVNFEDYEAGLFGEVMWAPNSPVVEHVDSNDYEWLDESLPLDCLTNQQRRVVEGLIYEGKTQIQLADEMGIVQRTVSDYFSAAQDKMAEFGKARKIISREGCTLRIHRYYVENMSQTEIAILERVKPHSISESINRWKSKYLKEDI